MLPYNWIQRSTYPVTERAGDIKAPTEKDGLKEMMDFSKRKASRFVDARYSSSWDGFT